MKTALVGYSGFVGSNILDAHDFNFVFNSKNIQESYFSFPDLLVYAGIPAEMFIANKNPKQDKEIIKNAIDNIKKINAARVVLISSVAVYDKTDGVDERRKISDAALLPYGRNRLYLEKWVLENCTGSLVIRLPAIYGKNLKKNFIYDYINICPAKLSDKKYIELSGKSDLIAAFYVQEKDGFYHNKAKQTNELAKLRDEFLSLGFSALNFTDSRSVYQFYNLCSLWKDIVIALDNKLRLVNLVTEPVSISEVYKYLKGTEFTNELEKAPYNYNIKTQYDRYFGGQDGFIKSKTEVLRDLKKFVDGEMNGNKNISF